MRSPDLSSLSEMDVMHRVQARVNDEKYVELSSLSFGKYEFILNTDIGTYTFFGFTPEEFGRNLVKQEFEGGTRIVDLVAAKIHPARERAA